MKNKLSKAYMGVCLLFAFSSCSDSFLEEKRDYNNLTTLDVYSDPDQATAVFATIYKQIIEPYNSPFCGSDPLMRQDKNTGGQQHIYTEELADNGFKDGRYNGTNGKNTKAGNHIANPPYWNDPKNSTTNYNNFSRRTLFPTVYVINNYITEIDRSRSLCGTEQFWNHLKGQAMFARAWLYFDAVRIWGGFPYYCTETDMAEMGDRSPRMAIQDCIDKVCDDFEAAAKLLPAKWEGEDYGRFTSVAALAMSARARVYMASPVFNASWDNPSGSRWQKALETSLAALTAADQAGYGTSVTNIDSWDKAFYTFDGTAFNPEAIITVLMNDDPLVGGTYNKWEGKIRPGVIAKSNASGICAPDQILKAFPMKSGKPATAENGYDDEKFYRDRDPRFYRTFAFSGCEWPGMNKQIWLYAYKYAEDESNRYRYTDGSKQDAGAVAKSRAIVWKMSNPAIQAGSESTAGTNVLEYRYAELLLNVAECYAAQGNSGKCLEYLGRIRGRVGIDAANNYGLGAISDRYQLIKAVLNERQVELAYEGKRSWDMRRWLLYEGGAGFDPRIGGGFNDNTRAYDPVGAWGSGWKIYDGKDGRENYTRTNNVLTKLGLAPFSGTKHTSKIWGYDLDNLHEVPEYIGTDPNHPLIDNVLLATVPGIKREMNEAERNEAFDKLEDFCQTVGIETYDPIEKMGPKYGMESGTKEVDQNFLFAWRGWYYIYPIHYDMYTTGKGNEWIEQTAGWMIDNANPAGNNMEEQDGTYYYCAPEK